MWTSIAPPTQTTLSKVHQIFQMDWVKRRHHHQSLLYPMHSNNMMFRVEQHTKRGCGHAGLSFSVYSTHTHIHTQAYAYLIERRNIKRASDMHQLNLYPILCQILITTNNSCMIHLNNKSLVVEHDQDTNTIPLLLSWLVSATNKHTHRSL